jgi:hypothetical protein
LHEWQRDKDLVLNSSEEIEEFKNCASIMAFNIAQQYGIKSISDIEKAELESCENKVLSFQRHKIIVDSCPRQTQRRPVANPEGPLSLPSPSPFCMKMRYCRQGSLQSNNYELEAAKENLQVLFQQHPDMRDQVLKVLEPEFALQSDLQVQLQKDQSKMAKKLAKQKKLRAIDSILKFKVDVAPWNPEASKAK